MKTFGVGGKIGLLIWVHIQLADCSGAFEDEKLEHVGVENHQDMRSLKPSSRSCATACVLNVDCVSFSYDLQSRICLLRNTIPGNNDIAYAKCKCQDDKCSLSYGFRSQVFRRLHPYVSESRVCGNQTYVTGARKHVSNGTTTYTCEHPDFKACVNKTTSVCQCTGTWDNWTGMCGRFRWRNLEESLLWCRSQAFTIHNHEFLCAQGRQLYTANCVALDAEATQGQDMVFYAYFRFQFNKQNHSVFCNTFVQDIWGTEQEWMSDTMHFGRECIVKIILRHGVYNLDVDGERRCTIPESVRGLHPEYIEIENDVTVNSVEIAV